MWLQSRVEGTLIVNLPMPVPTIELFSVASQCIPHLTSTVHVQVNGAIWTHSQCLTRTSTAVLLQLSHCDSSEDTPSSSVWIGITAGIIGAAILLCVLAGVVAVLGFLWRKRNRRGFGCAKCGFVRCACPTHNG